MNVIKLSSTDSRRARPGFIAVLILVVVAVFAIAWVCLYFMTAPRKVDMPESPVREINLEKGLWDIVVKAGPVGPRPPVLKLIVNRRIAGHRYMTGNEAEEYHFPILSEGGTVELIVASQPEMVRHEGGYRSVNTEVRVLSVDPKPLDKEKTWSRERLEATAEKNRRKIIMLGLDGADWDIIFDLIDQGKMPAFESLISRGTYGGLSTIRQYGLASPALWTTIVTGRIPREHGIRGFTYQGEDGFWHPYNRSDRMVPALWNILSHFGKKVVVVGFWFCDPAEPVNGILVGQNFIFGSESSVYPASRYNPLREYIAEWNLESITKEMKESIIDFDEDDMEKIYFFSSPQYEKNHKVRILFEAFKNDFSFMQTGRYLFSREKSDFFLLYLRGTDISGHFCWQETVAPEGEQHSGTPFPFQGKREQCLDNFYIWSDRLLSQLLESVDLDKDTVVIASDHGMESALHDKSLPMDIDLNFILKELQLLIVNDGVIDNENSTAYFRSPRLYVQKKIFLVDARQDRLERSEYLSRAERVKEALGTVTYDGGRPLFSNLEINVPSGEIVSLDEPAVFVDVDESAFSAEVIEIDGKKHPAASVTGEFGWKGSHRPEGIILLAGAGIKKGGVISRANLLDVTPTILALFGLPPDLEMQGVTLREALKEDPQTAPPGVYHMSYDYCYSAPEAGKKPPPQVEEKIMDQLKAIGYIR